MDVVCFGFFLAKCIFFFFFFIGVSEILGLFLFVLFAFPSIKFSLKFFSNNIST